jgi:CBS domain-containing protein
LSPSRCRRPSKIRWRPIWPLAAASSRCNSRVGRNSVVVTKNVHDSISYSHRELIRGRLDDSQEEVARMIAKYNHLALPIVDDLGRLRGIVTEDDAMDVILPADWKSRLPRIYSRA